MRIQKVLPDVISAPQKGFLKGRYIEENTRLVCDIINYLKGIKKEGLILLIDFQKAFDSLEWKYISEVLLAYNFGKCYRKWFKILYNKSCSSVINNGYLSESFPLERVCRQGDPLSPYIFILAIEPLAMMIKNNKQIEGIEVQNHTFKIGLYADDIFLLLKNSESSVRESIHVFRNFEICSGLKMNLEKTHVARIGHLGVRNRALCNDLNLIWVKDFRLLGIVFDNDVDKMLEKNFSNRLQGIEKLFNLYQKQHFSIIGKITMIVSLAILKLVYPLSVLPKPPHKVLYQLENMFRKFIWQSSRSQIAVTELQKDISEGGLRLTNLGFLNKAIKLSWIKRTLCKNNDFKYILMNLTGLEVKNLWELDCDSLHHISLNLQNNFWSEVIFSWKNYKELFMNKIDPRTYSLWVYLF